MNCYGYKQGGVTLLELLISLSVMCFLVLVAVPTGAALVEQVRADSTMNQLRAAYHFARAEAMTRGQTVIFCGSRDKQHCDGSWSHGQIIFVDVKNNQRLESQELLLREYPGLKGGASLQLSAFPSSHYLRLKPAGYNKQQNGTFTYQSAQRQQQYSRQLVISRSGRMRKVNEL